MCRLVIILSLSFVCVNTFAQIVTASIDPNTINMNPAAATYRFSSGSSFGVKFNYSKGDGEVPVYGDNQPAEIESLLLGLSYTLRL